MILAAAHSGQLPMRCSICEADATQKDQWGCVQPTKDPIWEDEGDVYYSCPILYISPEVVEWYREYDYCVNIRGMEYSSLPWSWLEAYECYRAAMTSYENRKNAEQARKANSISSARIARMRRSDDG